MLRLASRWFTVALIAGVASCTGGGPTGDSGNGVDATDVSGSQDSIMTDVAAEVATDVHADTPAEASCATPDMDHDGHCAIGCGPTCDDCDDTDPNRFPGNTEVCAFSGGARVNPTHDEDCDPTTFSNSTTRDGDHDGDGYVDIACCNGTHCGTDCADTAPVHGFAGMPYMTTAAPGDVHPMQPEICNDIDDNCNMHADEGVQQTFYRDCDGDLFGDVSDAGIGGCLAVEFPACMGHAPVTNHTDCDDHNVMVTPSAAMPCNCTSGHTYDIDGDGHDIAACGGDDCDDTSAAIFPGAHGTCDCAAARTMGPETCNGLDDDCDGTIDNEPATDAECVSRVAHSASTCASGACVLRCAANYYVSGAACAPLVPRPIAPLSTATVSSQRPTLRWAIPAGIDSVHADLCSDRACTHVITTIDTTGSSAVPTSALPPGVVFWRLTGSVGGTLLPFSGPTWQFTVGHRTASRDASWGTSLDVNGDGFADVVVGANQSTTAYVYLGSASGLVATPSTLTGPSGSLFGWSVASAGDTNGDGFADLVVGATGSDTAYLYLGSASGLVAPPTMLSGPGGSGFGSSVASGGDINGDGFADLVVGAQSPTAYLYLGSASGVVATPTALNGPSGITISVASAGDINGDGFADLVVGTSGSTAYVYLGGSNDLIATPTTLTGPSGSGFGRSVASAGDINGDGFADLVVGASFSNTAYVYFGSTGGLVATSTTLTGLSGSRFGSSVASAGDINGDGFADLVVGDPNSDTSYVYGGSASGLIATPTTLTGPSGGAFGYSVASAGDVNGDGFADLVAGAWRSNTAYVYLGSAGGLVATPMTLTGPSLSFFGFSVASAGNVNSGGIANRVVGLIPSATDMRCAPPVTPRTRPRT